MPKPKLAMISIGELVPYENNPRKNDSAVDAVVESIAAFGFQNPIVVDKDKVVIAGHTRLKAAERLGLDKVPVVVAEELTPEQAAAYRLADNKTAELAFWDTELLDVELAALAGDFDMSDFGFGLKDEAEEDEYEAFVDKFKPKLTTDDCYTPEAVYDVVNSWAVKEYKLEGREVVRPFWPGGDYQGYDYPDNCVVIDNPPFSIAAEIVRFYTQKGIDYFLFANHLTLFGANTGANYVVLNLLVIYENGAGVSTSFQTSLGDNLIVTAPELYQAITKVNGKETADLTSYDWPEELCTASSLGGLSKEGVSFAVKRSEALRVTNLDGAKELGKGVYGGGFLLSKTQAARAQAARAQAARAQAARAQAEKPKIKIELSARESKLVEELGKTDG